MKKGLGILIALLIISCNNMHKNPLVIGHRGAMGHETENTVASVEKALELGVDMIEIDVFQIQSGEIVVFHDERLERLSNAGGNIEEYTIFELNQVILDGNHKIPMLQDILKTIAHKVPLNIELKGTGTTDRVNFIINYYVNERGWKMEDFVISSFHWDELREMRKINSEISIAVLTEADPLDAITVAKELHAVAINPNYKKLTSENVQKIQQEGYKVFTWTVNEPEDILKVKSFGVDGIFTNYPERLR